MDNVIDLASRRPNHGIPAVDMTAFEDLLSVVLATPEPDRSAACVIGLFAQFLALRGMDPDELAAYVRQEMLERLAAEENI